MTKNCRVCGVRLDDDNKSSGSGNICKTCYNLRAKAWRKKNPTSYKASYLKSQAKRLSNRDRDREENNKAHAEYMKRYLSDPVKRAKHNEYFKNYLKAYRKRKRDAL